MVPLFGEVQANLGVLNNILQENIAGVRVVKAFAGEQREYARYTQQNNLLYQKNLAIINTFAVGFPTVFFLSNVGVLIVIWFGGNRVIAQALSLGDLIAFNSYLTYLLQPIFQFGVISQLLARANASSKRIFEVLEAQNEIVEKFRRLSTVVIRKSQADQIVETVMELEKVKDVSVLTKLLAIPSE